VNCNRVPASGLAPFLRTLTGGPGMRRKEEEGTGAAKQRVILGSFLWCPVSQRLDGGTNLGARWCHIIVEVEDELPHDAQAVQSVGKSNGGRSKGRQTSIYDVIATAGAKDPSLAQCPGAPAQCEKLPPQTLHKNSMFPCESLFFGNTSVELLQDRQFSLYRIVIFILPPIEFFIF